MDVYTDTYLWRRIEQYRFDVPGYDLPFSKRLARDNGWAAEYTARAIEEYRKFIYLTCVSRKIVTPSVDVDEVWHLHMTYTRDYWQNFCRDTLQREVHHEPTKGGSAERTKFIEAYERAISTYIEEFGQEPPSDIWPGASARFATPWRPTNPAASYVIPKRIVHFLACFVALIVGASIAFGAGVPAPPIGAALAFGTIFSAVFTLGRGEGGVEVSAESGSGADGGCGGGCGGCGG